MDNDVFRVDFADSFHVSAVEGNQIQLVENLQVSCRLCALGCMGINLPLQFSNFRFQSRNIFSGVGKSTKDSEQGH